MIELTHVSKRFPCASGNTQALREIDLEINRGEFVAVTGPSACGKTTLLNIVGLIDMPSSGRYRFDGTDVGPCSETELTELRRRYIGFVFQDFGLVDELTISENVELPLLYQGVPRGRRRVATREALEIVGLEERGNAHPDELSGGEQQRVAVARAVVSDPMLIIADEPTGNLDDESAERVLEMLTTLHAVGTTVLMVTHSPAFAARAERVVKLADGRVVA